MSIDIEGGELEALKTLNFDIYKPLLIAVEHNFRKDRKDISDLLMSQGYKRDPLQPSFIWDDWYILRTYFETND